MLLALPWGAQRPVHLIFCILFLMGIVYFALLAWHLLKQTTLFELSKSKDFNFQTFHIHATLTVCLPCYKHNNALAINEVSPKSIAL